MSNTITHKHNPGDFVYGVHLYSRGAKIFSGKISEVLIKKTPERQSIGYKLEKWPVRYLPEDCIFLNKEEAESARNQWIEQLPNNQDDLF